MLFGPGRPDVAGYAAGRPLAHPVDSTFCYSSGTSCIVERGHPSGRRRPDRVRGVHAPRRCSTRSACARPIPKFDAAGTWIGSSYCFSTAEDFARFGLLYLRDGVWDGTRVLPEGWVDHARTPQPDVDDDGWGYGAHWWLLPDRDDGLFFASGYRGQYTIVVPGTRPGGGPQRRQRDRAARRRPGLAARDHRLLLGLIPADPADPGSPGRLAIGRLGPGGDGDR